MIPSGRPSILSAGVAAALIAALGTVAPAEASGHRATVADGRTTTVRAACAGGGTITVTADQPSDGSVTVTSVARHMPIDSVWDGKVSVLSGDTHSGGGGAFGGQHPDANGSFTDITSVGPTTDPIVRLKFHSQDGSRTCIVRVRLDQQWARTSCSLSGRLLSVTAEQNATYLDVTTTFAPVPAKSAWNVQASVTSAHSSEGAGASTHASAAGVVRGSFGSFAYVANRTVEVSFTNPDGKGCGAVLGTHRLPTG